MRVTGPRAQRRARATAATPRSGAPAARSRRAGCSSTRSPPARISRRGWWPAAPLVDELRGVPHRARARALAPAAVRRRSCAFPPAVTIAADGRASAPRAVARPGASPAQAAAMGVRRLRVGRRRRRRRRRNAHSRRLVPGHRADGRRALQRVRGGRPAAGRRDAARGRPRGDRRRIPRFGRASTGARFETPVRVLGPLAVEARAAGTTGLLLAGDAAGFVDPMTGDGLHLAMRGAVLAAREALSSLETGGLRRRGRSPRHRPAAGRSGASCVSIGRCAGWWSHAGRG